MHQARLACHQPSPAHSLECECANAAWLIVTDDEHAQDGNEDEDDEGGGEEEDDEGEGEDEDEEAGDEVQHCACYLSLVLVPCA